MNKLARYTRAIVRKFVEHQKRLTPPKMFIFLSVFFGLIFIIITPPFQTPDEAVHFNRAYQISEFNLIPEDIGPNMQGGKLPRSLSDTENITTANPDLKYKPEEKYNWYNTLSAFSIKNKQEERVVLQTSSALFTPIMYLPQAMTIILGRLLNAPPILMMYMARLAILSLWVVLYSCAIKLIPRKKWVMAVIGLLPMALFQAVSLGGDMPIIALSALLFAYILHIREQKSLITGRQLFPIFIIAISLVLAKAIMVLFLPLLILIPTRHFSVKKASAYILKTALFIVPLLFLVAWMFLIRNVSTRTIGLNPSDPDTARQIQFILHHPQSYVNVLWNTSFFVRSDDITRSLIGTFGWLDAPLSEGIVTIGYVGLVFMFIADYGKHTLRWLKKWEKLVIVILLMLYWLAVNTVLYTACSAVGSKIICGLQGRYFIPMLIPLVPVLYGVNWIKTNSEIYRRIAIGLPIFLLTTSTITIWFRYYIHNF